MGQRTPDWFSANRHQLRRSAGLGVVGAALMTAAIAASAGWVEWTAVGRWAGAHAVLLIGAALIATAAVRFLRRSPPPAVTPALSWWMLLAAGAIVAAVAWGTTSWLLREAAKANDPAAARVEAVKTGLGIGAGTGGVFALLLGVRRQWHQETTAKDTSLDATERRITELYTKAAEQLGSPHAAVRLAGLYAMQRLGRNTESQRATIGNVLCAYLRMPYTQPGEEPGPKATADERDSFDRRKQEHQVRNAAIRILHRHLQPGPDRWPSLVIDLAGVDLTNADLTDAEFRKANLSHAKLTRANLTNATLIGADLTNADLASADLTNANLRHTDLTNAKLGHAKIGYTDFTNADLTGADLTDPVLPRHALGNRLFRSAEFAGVRWSAETKWPTSVRDRAVELSIGFRLPDDLRHDWRRPAPR